METPSTGCPVPELDTLFVMAPVTRTPCLLVGTKPTRTQHTAGGPSLLAATGRGDQTLLREEASATQHILCDLAGCVAVSWVDTVVKRGGAAWPAVHHTGARGKRSLRCTRGRSAVLFHGIY